MSSLSIAPYFPFRRVRLLSQFVIPEAGTVRIEVEPDRRFHPICHLCGHAGLRVHDWQRRSLRDLNLGSTKVWIDCSYRKVLCGHCCRTQIEDLELFSPYQRVTKRLARYIHDLCKVMTVKEVADHVALDWKTVKNIDKAFLEEQYRETDYENLRILAIDEISVRKRYRYMTVVLDYLTGRVVWMGKDRKTDTLRKFFKGMTECQKQRLEAIAVDMWDAYIRAIREAVPHVKIVFDLFHVVSVFSKLIDKVRKQEYRKAKKEDQSVFKGSRYLLLRNRSNIRKKKHREQLKRLLALNETISSLMILKDKLKQIWRYRRRGWAEKALREWCQIARAVGNLAVTKFANMLERYQYGILNHCDYPIHTGMLEGTNNKIKVIKRKAYGFHDDRYFQLKVLQAFDPKLDPLDGR
jgi:transposase